MLHKCACRCAESLDTVAVLSRFAIFDNGVIILWNVICIIVQAIDRPGTNRFACMLQRISKRIMPFVDISCRNMLDYVLKFCLVFVN